MGTVQTPKGPTERTRIEVRLIVPSNDGSIEVKALLDSGADLNLISQSYVVEHKLAYDKHAFGTIYILNSEGVKSYGELLITTDAIDSYDGRFTYPTRFTAVDMTGYEFLLGMPWLYDINPRVDWREATWTHAASPTHLVLESGKDFARRLIAEPVYIALRIPHTEYSITTRGACVFTASGAPTEKFDSVPTVYSDLLDVFSEAEARVLPPHGEHNHRIKLTTEAIPHKPLYPLSETELKVLREYLEQAL